MATTQPDRSAVHRRGSARRLGEGAKIVLAGVGGYVLSMVGIVILMECIADREDSAAINVLPALYAVPFTTGFAAAHYLASRSRKRRVERARKRGRPEAAAAPIRPQFGILPAGLASFYVGLIASVMIAQHTGGGVAWGVLALCICVAPYAMWATLYRAQLREYHVALDENTGRAWASFDRRIRQQEHQSVVGTWFTAFLFTTFLVAPCAIAVGSAFGLRGWAAWIPPSGVLVVVPITATVVARRSRWALRNEERR
jgi:hypothetical protein